MTDLSNPYVDSHLKEHIRFQDERLHYSAYLHENEPQFYGDILWHWHDEFEFGYVTEGSILYKTNQHEYILHKGDGIFINSGVLHYLHPFAPLGKVKLQTQFLDKAFLGGYAGSIFDLKYVSAVAEQKQSDVIPFYHQNAADRPLLAHLQNAVLIMQEQKNFFEFRLRNLFSVMWETVYARALALQPPEITFNLLEDERIKHLISFINEHYSEKLTVSQMAKSIPVSERECFRLFQNMLGMTPVEFLISYRLKKACELLVTTQKNILEIALECGFGNSSYFGKLFRQQYHTAPGEYRAAVLSGKAKNPAAG